MIHPEQLVDAVIDSIFEATPEEVNIFIDDVVVQAVETVKKESESVPMTTNMQLHKVARLAANLAAGRGTVVSAISEAIDLTQSEDAEQRPHAQMKTSPPITARNKGE